ncbi:MAG: hypothetical protein JKX92_12180 [Porticoccaceae bacterium]|nr:hypothetical protein [Porticoccaceae bacterium]
MACQNQWFQLLAPMSSERIRTGLRWAEVESRARNLAEYRQLSRSAKDQLWLDLEVLQNAALQTWATER